MTDSNGGEGSDRDPPPSGSSDGDRSGGDAAQGGDSSGDGEGSDRSVDENAENAAGDRTEPADEGEMIPSGDLGADADDDVEPNGGEPATPSRSDGTSRVDEPAPEAGAQSGQSIPDPSENPIGWFRRTDNEAVIVFKDVASSVGIVVVIGLVLFGVSGVWPPLVAIESASMNPHMEKGDLVFIMEEDRLEPDAAIEGTGVVTYQQGQEAGYRTFGSYGDVIVFQPNGQSTTPIIHRAMFYVDEGENWYEKANESHIQADSCEEIDACSAEHSGFVTKGDNPRTNQQYDQVDRYQIVKPEWIQGTAEVRLPWLGCIRLEFSGTASCRPLFGTAQPASPGAIGDSPSLSSGTAIVDSES